MTAPAPRSVPPGPAGPAGPASRSRRTARPSGDDREAAILATAEALLAGRSLAEISVDDLASGAGISRPTFYFYFASKDAVLLALVDRVITEANAALAGVCDLDPDDARSSWHGYLSTVLDTFRRHRAVMLAAAVEAPRNAAVREVWSAVMTVWVNDVERAIVAERRRGAAPDGPPARDLAIVLNSMNERVMHATLSREGPAVDAAGVVDVLLDVWMTSIYRGTV